MKQASEPGTQKGIFMYTCFRFALILTGITGSCNHVYAQADSLGKQEDKVVRSFFAGAGPIFAFGPVYLNFTGGLVFKGGWGVGVDFVRDKYETGSPGIDLSGAYIKTSLTTVRVIRQFDLSDDKLGLQVSLGPSFGSYKNTYWSEPIPGSQEMWDVNGKSVGLGSKVSLVYRINRVLGVSGGTYLGFNSAFHLNGLEAGILVGDLGVASATGYNRRKPLESYTFDELVTLERKTRNQAKLGLIAGSILTGAAVACNVIAVSEYHKNDTWSRLGGTVAFAISHLGFAPAGTGLLIWGFGRRGKANTLKNLTAAHTEGPGNK